MAQKVNKPTPAPIIITITLPEEDKLLRTGQILIQRSGVATLRQFEYNDLSDIMTAIQDSATWLTEVEANPPDLTPAPPQASGEGDPTQPEGSTAQDEASAGQETGDQATGSPESAPAVETVQIDQLQLF